MLQKTKWWKCFFSPMLHASLTLILTFSSFFLLVIQSDVDKIAPKPADLYLSWTARTNLLAHTESCWLISGIPQELKKSSYLKFKWINKNVANLPKTDKLKIYIPQFDSAHALFNKNKNVGVFFNFLCGIF